MESLMFTIEFCEVFYSIFLIHNKTYTKCHDTSKYVFFSKAICKHTHAFLTIQKVEVQNLVANMFLPQ